MGELSYHSTEVTICLKYTMAPSHWHFETDIHMKFQTLITESQDEAILFLGSHHAIPKQVICPEFMSYILYLI